MDVRLDGDLIFPREQLDLRIRTRANREMLGIPGARWWLWIYRFGESIGGVVGRGIQATGEPPARLDTLLVRSDVERLRLFYVQEGYRSARITYGVEPTDDRGTRVRVRLDVDAGPPTFIRAVRFRGVGALEPDRRNRLVRASLLDLDGRDTSFVAQGERYSEPRLLQEGRRIMAFLRNEGYATVIRDSIHAIVIPAREDSFDVVFDIRTGERHRFGNFEYWVDGPEEAPGRLDTLSVDGAEVPVRFTGERNIETGMLERTMRARPGAWYDQSLLTTTKRRLDATGVFAFTEFIPQPTDTLVVDSVRVPAVPFRFELQARRRHLMRFESFMLQRSGALADADNELGTGVAMTYSNLNLFGGGETFRLRTSGSVAADLGERGGFTSAQWDVSGSVTFPYSIFPFRGVERRLDLFDARTQLSVSLLAARRDALRLVLRGRGNARYRLEMRHQPTLTSFVDLLDLSISNPDTLSGFEDIFLDEVLAAIEDPVQRGQVLEDYTQPQVNSALRYTFRSARVDPFRREDGYSYDFSIEMGGNLPYLLDRYAFSPSEQEGSLPGLPFFGGGGEDNRLLYRRYVRGLIDLRKYRPLGTGTVFAWKAVVGVAQPIGGGSDVVPFDRRFYSGGASSVRAWRLRQLGPGSASFVSDSDSLVSATTSLLGGEIKLEGSIELRYTVLRNVLTANWIAVLFTDVGNVWFGPENPGSQEGRFRFDRFYREIGVGSGIGVRAAWEYLIVRLDAAYKVHDPLRRGEYLPDGFGQPVLQFGIGHTF